MQDISHTEFMDVMAPLLFDLSLRNWYELGRDSEVHVNSTQKCAEAELKLRSLQIGKQHTNHFTGVTWYVVVLTVFGKTHTKPIILFYSVFMYK